MAQLPPAGWYADPDGGGAPRWWDGHRWAPPSSAGSAPGPAPRAESRSSRIVVGATIAGAVLFFASIGAVTGGIGGFLSIVGLSGLVVGIVAVVRGGIASLAIRNRAIGGAVLAAGFLVMFTGGGIGAATSPRPVSLVHAGSDSQSPPSTTTSPSPTPSPTTIVTEITETESIPFDSVTVDDPAAASGTSVVSVAGVDGVLTVTYRVTTVDGVETSRVKVGEAVTTSPVSQVTSVGSRVDRQPVAAPAAPAAPAGGGCDPNYSGCVPIASDVDCAGGSGNGPAYAQGPVNVIGSDIYDLDNDDDGVACE